MEVVHSSTLPGGFSSAKAAVRLAPSFGRSCADQLFPTTCVFGRLKAAIPYVCEDSILQRACCKQHT